jgi:hypothetical protein
MPETLVRFSGTVSCQRGAAPLGLTLSGRTGAAPGEPTTLAFSGAAAAQLPVTLTDALVERLEGRRYRISSAQQAWEVEASALHLHIEVARPFYAALPPRRVPLAKRLLWTAVLRLAASRAGLKLLAALRR